MRERTAPREKSFPIKYQLASPSGVNVFGFLWDLDPNQPQIHIPINGGSEIARKNLKVLPLEGSEKRIINSWAALGLDITVPDPDSTIRYTGLYSFGDSFLTIQLIRRHGESYDSEELINKLHTQGWKVNEI